ncbi:peroxiredoxin family protein [Pseudalkalibacillus hwajinpoensis]|uniref:TlpA family protein disulfide reductase n=1 Tax=Guptibacillus hwajinpoensis TaxID=208199 RepID=A0A4U1MLC2_9BACL|nr:TlpA disulfide reductase family protein [Pseudalkalibacillus hwajinpoensis]TKD72279.1 TlpA family protein disulfide reductase [Pseudalkalibacillus hwajinpoensis]
MKKTIFIIVVLGMLGWAVYDFTISTDDTNEANNSGTSLNSQQSIQSSNEEENKSKSVGLNEGQIAPDFTLQTPNGETVQLSDYRGERVIVNFWATWCPPCRAEIPDFQKLYEDKDVEILAVNLTETEESVDEVKKFIKEFEMTFPVVMDDSSEVSDTYQVRAYPTSYMIDSEGRIQFVARGALNYDLMVQEYEKMK